LPLARLIRNPAAGIAIRFESLPWTEGLYRWELDDPSALALKINTSHRLYQGVGNPGSHLHRLYSGYVIGLALAERLLPVSGHLVADYVETITSEFLIKSE
jgi:hypothetical protein